MKKKILLDSPFSYHLFVCYLHHLHQITPQSSPRSFCGPRKKTAPDFFFPFSIRILITKRKATTIYTCFTTSLCHHDKEGKKWLAMCFWKKNQREASESQKIWKRNDDKKGIKKVVVRALALRRKQQEFFIWKMRHILPFAFSGSRLRVNGSEVSPLFFFSHLK